MTDFMLYCCVYTGAICVFRMPSSGFKARIPPFQSTTWSIRNNTALLPTALSLIASLNSLILRHWHWLLYASWCGQSFHLDLTLYVRRSWNATWFYRGTLARRESYNIWAIYCSFFAHCTSRYVSEASFRFKCKAASLTYQLVLSSGRLHISGLTILKK